MVGPDPGTVTAIVWLWTGRWCSKEQPVLQLQHWGNRSLAGHGESSSSSPKETEKLHSQFPAHMEATSSKELDCMEVQRNHKASSLPALTPTSSSRGCHMGCGNNSTSISKLDPAEMYEPVWSRSEPGVSASRGVEQTSSQGNKLFQCFPQPPTHSAFLPNFSPPGTSALLRDLVLSVQGGGHRHRGAAAGAQGTLSPTSPSPLPAASAVVVALPAEPRGTARAGQKVVLLVQRSSAERVLLQPRWGASLLSYSG